LIVNSVGAALLRGEPRWDECQRYPGVPACACDDLRSAEAIAACLVSHPD